MEFVQINIVSWIEGGNPPTKHKGGNMFKQLDMKIIGAIALIAIVLLAGTIIYTRWSYKKFASEIDATPQSTTFTQTETDTPTKQSKTTQPNNVILDTKSAQVAESPQTHNTEDKEVSAESEKVEKPTFDAVNLLPALGLPEEVTSLFDGEPDEEAYEKAETYLQEKYGESAEVKSIMDRLKAMSGGSVDIEDLTALFEDWIQVLPEDQQENRQNLMNILTMLRQLKIQDAEVYVVTDSNTVSNIDEIDPSLLENAVVGDTIITNVETIIVDPKVETTIVDE